MRSQLQFSITITFHDIITTYPNPLKRLYLYPKQQYGLEKSLKLLRISLENILAMLTINRD
jgi:hypothetical protein